ncbi:SIS domain-containing protein [Pseudarthrobacter sp. CC12]|uniref:SIS domain-containing protein n=1 Tax=Pseudarthrobacter sp. CC12 TaxID=3029193 RepID=UPI0032648F5A
MTTSSTRADIIVDAARAAIRREAKAVEGLASQIDHEFVEIVHQILDLTGKIITTGTGTSGIMAERLAHLLAVSGSPAFYLPCLDALHGGMGAITEGDLVVAMSKGGQSTELIELVQRLGERGIPVVALTERPDSPFAKAAQRVAHVKTEPSDADPGGLIAMGSTLVAGAWGDALAIVLMALRGHSWEEVVHIHPGGIVGQQTDLPPEVEL